ncbi:MAG: spore germination protein GerW family protein [Ilumatobacteraceae bacterium]
MSKDEVLESIKGTHDSLSVRRCYGDPVELDGVTVIPVARVSGGAGGGGGEGTDENDVGGGGFGTGFGLKVNPIGVYEVRNGSVVWKPTVDVNRLLKGGQVLAGIFAVCTTLVLLVRRR